MKLSPITFDDTLNKFLASWSLDRVRNMDIHEYADLSDHDSLCYWLEYGTKDLGEIGGISLRKFELWKEKAEKERDPMFISQDGFVWNAKKGDSLDAAFHKIREEIIQIVDLAIQGNWKGIDKIPYHAVGKWKIACLFSSKQLLPIYTKPNLQAIAIGLGHYLSSKTPISELHSVILSHKSDQEDIAAFAARLYLRYGVKQRESERNYFIIGSIYNTSNVMKDFLQHNCVAMGWIYDQDFSRFMGTHKNHVDTFVEKHYHDSQPARSAIARYFRLFSTIKAGDIIAVKSQGAYSKLKIIAYAQVVERNGSIYFHNTDLLGHHINVEFLETGFVLDTGENYAATIHQLSAQKDGKAFDKIFGTYAAAMDPSYDDPEADDSLLPDTDQDIDQDSGGYNVKDEGDYLRSPVTAALVKRVHAMIQNRFMTYLNIQYPQDTSAGEKRYVDAKRTTINEIILYEIKPHHSPRKCIREGIGQLMDYMHKDPSPKPKNLVIVGQGHPTDADRDFISQMKTLLNVPFSYIAFNTSNLEATEY